MQQRRLNRLRRRIQQRAGKRPAARPLKGKHIAPPDRRPHAQGQTGPVLHGQGAEDWPRPAKVLSPRELAAAGPQVATRLQNGAPRALVLLSKLEYSPCFPRRSSTFEYLVRDGCMHDWGGCCSLPRGTGSAQIMHSLLASFAPSRAPLTMSDSPVQLVRCPASLNGCHVLPFHLSQRPLHRNIPFTAHSSCILTCSFAL